MRHFKRDEWYFDGFTWCGVKDNGEVWYPISWGDNARVWGMTRDIQNCLNHGTIKRVEKQIKAELKHNPFFKCKYKKVYLVHIKEYPTFYFDYYSIAKQLKIKLNHTMCQKEIIAHLTKYGFEPISDNPKIIEVDRKEINIEEL